jgi:hypothetical protein
MARSLAPATSPVLAGDRHEAVESPIVLVAAALLVYEPAGVTSFASSGFPKLLALVVVVLEEEAGNAHVVAEPSVTQWMMRWAESENRCEGMTEMRR